MVAYYMIVPVQLRSLLYDIELENHTIIELYS